MKRILSVLILSLAALGPGSITVHSTILTWNGSTSTDWNNATNWLPQQVPTAIDHLIFSGGTLTAPTNGAFAVMDWSGGSLYGSLRVTSGAVLNLGGNSALFLRGSLTNAGTVNCTNTGYLNPVYSPPTDYGAIYNLPGALFNFKNDQAYVQGYYGGEVFNNAGTLRKSAGTGITQISVQFINTGMVDAQTGTFSFNASGAISSQYNAVPGATIVFTTGSYTVGNSPQFTGGGAFQFTSGTLTLSNNVLPNLQLLGGSLVLGPAFQGGTITNLNLPGMALTGSNVVTGALTLGGGGSGPLKVVAGGVLNWMAGGLGNPTGWLTVANGGVLNLGGSQALFLYGALTNSGTVNCTNTGYLNPVYSPPGANGAIYNLAGGLFDFKNDQAYVSSYFGGEIFNNAGTLRKSAGAGTSQINLQFNNTGLVDAETGTILFNGGGPISSQFNAAGGATVAFSIGSFFPGNALQFTGAGAFKFVGGTLTLSNNVLPGLQLLGGTLALGPAFQGGSITNLTLPGMALSGSNVVTGTATLGGGGSGPLKVAAGGVLNWTGGGLGNPSGWLAVASGGTLVLGGSSALSLFETLTNAGTVVVTNTDHLVFLYSPPSYNGAIYNLAGGLFDFKNDQFYLENYFGTEFFNNAGTLRKSGGNGTTIIYPQLTNNTGLIEADSGTMQFQVSPNLTGGEVRFGLSSLSSYGKINVQGNASLAGTVGVAWLGGYVPATNNSFTVLSYGSHSGIFTALDLPSAALWATNYTATTFTVTVASINNLAFSAPPVGNKLTNVILAPVVVQVNTPTGVPVATNGVPITLALVGGGPINETLTQNTDATGKATFNNLSFSQPGFKTLRASSASQTAVTSLAFRILAVQEVQWTTNGFLLSLNGSNNLGTTIIYATTNLTSPFIPIYTNLPTTNSIQFLDTASTNYRTRFYHAIEQ